MPSRLPENSSLRKTRTLTQALILSGMLNIGLIASFIYAALQEKQQSLAIELKPIKEQSSSLKQITNTSLLKNYSMLPFQQLCSHLENKERAEEGFYKRDLALTCLVAFHHFNLDKALYGFPLQKRSISLHNEEGQEKIELPIYPGLSDDQFHAIMRYAKTEKWPLTSQGLFYELQRSGHPRDATLIESFCLSSEYDAVYTLFSKTALPLSCECLIDLLCEGEWKILADLTLSQRQALDLSLDRRRALLLAYLDCRSKTAAKLLLETDFEFLLKRCDDAQILTLLDLYEEKYPHLETCAKALLISPRTDAIWKRAAAILYTLSNETIPEFYDHRAVLQRFISQPEPMQPPLASNAVPTQKSNPGLKISKKLYIVESGDNLWKISRKFRVSIEELMRANHLDTEKLRPGKQLEIPIREATVQK